MDVGSTSSMQQIQTRKIDSSGGGQGSGGMGGMMKATMAGLSEETQTDIKSLMQTLDPTSKQDAMKQITEMDSSNMTVEDLTSSIMDLLSPNESAEE